MVDEVLDALIKDLPFITNEAKGWSRYLERGSSKEPDAETIG